MSNYLRVRSGFLRNGRMVKSGEIVSADDPIMKDIPADYVEPLDDLVETATRRPGERRVLPGQPPSTVVMRAERPARGRARKATPSKPADADADSEQPTGDQAAAEQPSGDQAGSEQSGGETS